MKHFRYKNLLQLQQDAEAIGARDVAFQPDANRVRESLSRKVQVGSFTVGNSMAIHPMEGCDGTLDGRPDELTYRRYDRFAQGGAKLLWFEATAVVPEGRANTRQLLINEETLPSLADVLERTRRLHRERWGTSDDLLDVLQLTHSGRYAVPRKTIAFHNPVVDQKTHTPRDYPVITDDELERLEDDYVLAAQLAVKAGFRAIDLKVTHGYLLAELMHSKEREGRYGGLLENRTRFVRNVFGKVRASVGDQLLLGMRLSCYEGVPYVRGEDGVGVPIPYPVPYNYGFGVDSSDPMREDLGEVKQAIQMFREAGLQLLNVSLACPYYNPHISRPFEKPDEGNYESPEHPLTGVDRHFRIAGELQRTFPDLPMVGTGYSWLQKYASNAAAHNIESGSIRFFGYGRGALAYPEFAEHILNTGELQEIRVCKTLTYCTFLMRQKDHPLGQWPAGCPPFDKEGYGQLMKEARLVKRIGAAQS